jgi:hypothetical protein
MCFLTLAQLSSQNRDLIAQSYLLDVEAPSAEVVGEEESEGSDVLAEVQRFTEAVSAGGTLDHGESTSAVGAWRVSLTAEARVFEEPGAGKPHAGICAGGA